MQKMSSDRGLEVIGQIENTLDSGVARFATVGTFLGHSLGERVHPNLVSPKPDRFQLKLS